MGQYKIEDLEKVYRYYPENRVDYDGEILGCYMEYNDHGEYVSYEDYEMLLNAYKELKQRMEGLEK